jgi:hypothetical protein
MPVRTSGLASLIRSVFVKQDNRLKFPEKQTKGDLPMLRGRISLQYRLIWPIRRNNIGLNRIALDLVYSNCNAAASHEWTSPTRADWRSTAS